MEGAGEQGIVDAVYGLSGYPVQILDQFGLLSVWAGPADAPPSVTRTRNEYNQLCDALARTSGLARHGQHLVAYAVSRGEPLGVLAMFDPPSTPLMTMDCGSWIELCWCWLQNSSPRRHWP